MAIILSIFTLLDIRTMILKTRVFDLYTRNYRNLSELAQAMEMSVSQVYRVKQGKRGVNQAFIVGALTAFPEYKFDDLFFVAQGGSEDDRQERASRHN